VEIIIEKHLKIIEIMEINYNSDEDKYLLARKKVESIKGFYGNLIVFIAVNAVLIFINLSTSPDHLWFYWPLMWWGLGLVFHGLKVYEVFPCSKGWEERKIKELMEKEKENKNKWQ